MDMNNLKQLFTSKKFWVMVGGLVAIIVVAAVPSLEQYQDSIPNMVWTVVAYLIAQGFADFGKNHQP